MAVSTKPLVEVLRFNMLRCPNLPNIKGTLKDLGYTDRLILENA